MASRSKKLNPDGVQPAGKAGISLPEEILSEILSVALAVPDEVFSDNGPDPSPFATLEEPSSSFLLVCKAWFRCGCRQLYKVIVLRSTAQAKALAQVLSNTAELGQYVEKLRVEGGYGASMRTILKCSPNISHLFLALDITAGDATTGLCDGLPLINPTCVILRHKCYTYLNNKMMRNLTSTLGDCFSRWDNLQVIDLPRALLSPDPRFRTIFDSLKKSITLHTVVIPEADYADASQVALRLKETGLRNIKVKNPIRNKWEVKYGFFDHFAEDPTVTAMLQYTVVEEKLPPSRAKEKTVQPTNIQPSVAPSPNSSFIPMDSASVAVRESVWKRVLYFAMFILEQEADIYRKDLPQRLPLLLVSKTFNKLALPYYYSFVSLKSARTIPKFLHILVNHPTVGPQVRVIFGSLGRPQAPDPMATILSLTSRLQQFHHRSYVTRYESGLEFRSRSIEEPSILSWDAFAALAKSSGSTLREFSQQVEHGYELWPTQVFNRFTQLTSLDWKSPIEFDSIQLSSLQRLTLSENISDATKLLHSCGSTLAELTLVFEAVKNLDINLFVLCPNLTFVVMCFKISSNILPHVTDFVSESIAHHHLTRFKFKFPENYWSSNRNRRHTSCWDDIFEALPTHFPNLREIQLTGFAWPKTEREIAKSFWVKLAERFLESGVTMMDADGKKWRGRLESKRSLRVNRT